MSSRRRTRILALVPRGEKVPRLTSFLSRSQMEVEQVSSGDEALEVLAVAAFDLATAILPLPDMSVGRLVTEVRDLRREKLALPLILLARAPQLDAARVFEAPEIRVLDLADSGARLQSAIAEVLGIATRLSLRIPIQLEVGIGKSPSVRFCETRNLSTSGMLISSGQPLPIGSFFEFELTLPHSTDPLTGSAKVIRLSDPMLEGTTGFGARFLSLDGSGEDRIRQFIHAEAKLA